MNGAQALFKALTDAGLDTCFAKTIHKQGYIAIALLGTAAFTTSLAGAADPLPSWNDWKRIFALYLSAANVLTLVEVKNPRRCQTRIVMSNLD